MAAMSVVVKMIVVSLAGVLAVAALDASIADEVFYGMLGPLVAVAGSWILVERTARVNPAGVNNLMMAAFAVKMVFFGLYAVVVLALLDLRRVPFAMSFTAYFVALYATEAWLMRRLFDRLARAS